MFTQGSYGKLVMLGLEWLFDYKKPFKRSSIMSQLTSPEEMAAFFNARVADYEEHMKQNPNYFEEKRLLAEQFELTSEPVEILDLGCGTGLEIKYILKRSPKARFLGIDLSEAMLESLRKKYQAVLDQIELIKGSYFDYDFGRNRFDYVVASATMHHWLPEKKIPLYKRIFASLKPGGKFSNDDYLVPEKEERELLERYLRLQESGLLKDGIFYHVDIPCSVPTETKIMNDAGFQRVKVVYEHFSATHNNALLVGFKDRWL